MEHAQAAVVTAATVCNFSVASEAASNWTGEPIVAITQAQETAVASFVVFICYFLVVDLLVCCFFTGLENESRQ
jgi:hypothetical protein